MVNFPQSFDDDDSLFLAVNNLRTQLTVDMTDSDTTATVVTTTGFPPTGYISILTGDDILDMEAITYSGTTDFTFLNLLRGADGTEAFEHFAGNNVDQTIVAQHHNELKDAIIILEEFVGVSGSENFVPKDEFGNVTITGALTLTTGTITAGGGGIFSETLTISGAPVLTSLSENFVPKDEFGNVIITGTLTVFNDVTFSGGLEAGATVITGTLSVCDDADFKTDVTISGCLQVGQAPVSSTPEATYEFEDAVYTTTQETTYDDTGVSIVPDSGVNLLLYRASSSASSAGAAVTSLRALYAGTELGASDGSNESATGGHWNSTDFAGFKVVTTNAVDVLKLQGKSALASSRNADVGSQQLISVPLESLGLVEEEDYWFDNGSESNFLIPLASGTDIVTVNSFDITVPVTGPYLLMGGADTQMTIAAAVGAYAVYVYANESNISNHMVRDANNSSFYHTNSWFQVINLTAGANNISIRSRRWNGVGALNLKRARLCLINGSSFDNMTGTRTFCPKTNTSSSTFTEMLALAQTHVPSEQGQVLVFGSSNSRSFDVVAPEAVPTFKIRDDTDGVDYAEDFGEGMTSAGGAVTTIHTNAFAIKDDAIASTDWKMFIREANATGNAVETNHSALVVWSLIAPTETVTPLTTIKKDKITTPFLCADNITVINSGTLTIDIGGELVSPIGTFSESLTISGVPVATGTSGGGGGASTLQEAYDGGDGTISTTGGKPFELTGKGELVAVTGTFSTTLTISGQPVATGTSGAGGGGAASVFVHTQGAADTTWSINHGLGTEVVNYITIDNSDEQVYPDTFTIDDSNNVTIDWVAPQDGKAYIFGDTAATQIGNLQFAYDSGDGSIVTVPGKPVLISGTEFDDDVDFKVIGSGTFTEALTVGEGTTYLDNTSITTGSGIFTDSMTISGSSVLTSESDVGGGGGSALTVKEADGSPSVANVDTIVVTDGTLTDDGGGQVTIDTGGTGGGGGGGSGELTFSGAPRFIDPARIYNALIPPSGVFIVEGVGYDDEFQGEVGTPISTDRWTVFDPGAALTFDPPQLTGGDKVRFQVGGDPNGEDFVGIFQASPSLITRFGVYTTLANGAGSQASIETYQGVMFLEDSTSPSTTNILLMGTHMLTLATTPTFEVGIWEFTSYTDTAPTQRSVATSDLTDFNMSPLFINALWHGSGGLNRFDIHYSLDGNGSWYQAGEIAIGNLSMSTFDAVGLGYIEIGGFIAGAEFSFFRMDSGSASRPVPAGFMYVETDPTTSGLNVSGTVTGDVGSALIVEEQDGGPTVTGVTTIRVTNSTLTDEGGGIVSIDTGGTGGGGGGVTTSGLWFNVHAIPEDPSPFSDYFDDNSTNPTLSGSHAINWDKWTQWDVDAVSGTTTGETMVTYGGGNGTVTHDSNMMRITHDASTLGGWTGVYQDAPSGSFTITTRVGVQSPFTSNVDIRMGIFIADDLTGAPSTSDLYSASLYHVPGAQTDDTVGLGLYSQIEQALWVDYNSISTEVTTAASPHPGVSAWLRINYNSGSGRAETSISEDGITWKKLLHEDLIFTPSQIGFGINKGDVNGVTAVFEFFAVHDSLGRRGDPMGYGRLVPVVISGATGGGGGSSVGQFTQVFTDQTSISVAHNAGSLVHFTTVLDESNFVVEAEIQYGENTDEVTLSELMSGSVVVLG